MQTFSDFLNETLTMKEMELLEKMVGSKRMLTSIKHKPGRMTSTHLKYLVQVLRTRNPQFNAQYLIDNFWTTSVKKPSVKRKSQRV
ncbi:MAG TPA: hypothetical protein PLX17_03815 [Chitinophagaceae bacterium]|nr:hypothetical protein [Chitinophagaceae bacterium]HQW95194.1 hypothetical protein [Saprospiraceae bacterium]